MVRPLEIGPLIIDPPMLQAPMAGFTNYAFRQIVRTSGGVGLAGHGDVQCPGLLGDRFPLRLVRPSGCGAFWRSLARWRRRSGTTIRRSWRKSAGGWPASFTSAWSTSISAVPVIEVTEKAHSGSYLLRYPDRVGQIVAAVAKACAPTPVTAKIRLGACRDTINASDVAQAVEDAGGAALTVHGRTAADMFRGSADWEEISRIKPYLVPHSPDRQRRPHDASGRGRGLSPLRYRRRDDWPGGAQPALAFPPGPGRAARRADPAGSQPGRATATMLLEHFRLLTAQFGQQQGTVLMRKFACCYATGRPAPGHSGPT